MLVKGKKQETTNNVNTLPKQKTNKKPIKQPIDEDIDVKVKDKIWEHIFTFLNYDCKNDKVISANDIKDAHKTWNGESNQFEPRLLCKHDTDEERPKIFKENGLCILSIKNGSYLITKNNIYCQLIYPEKKTELLKKDGTSLLLKIGESECSLIDNLRYSGLFEKPEYLNEPILFGPLLNGRHRCNFKTKLGTTDIEINGSQYETDSAYESKNKILLIEGKTIDKITSFNIRQLYYPYRTIYDIVNGQKEIICLFINKSKDGSIHIWNYTFEDPLSMSSIKMVSYNKYKLY